MHVVNIHEAKTHLSRLLEEVERGNDVVIARAGQPFATLTAYRREPRKIAPPGCMKGRDWLMANDIDAPVEGLLSCLQYSENETGLQVADRSRDADALCAGQDMSKNFTCAHISDQPG